jgi:hypothetical protein
MVRFEAGRKEAGEQVAVDDTKWRNLCAQIMDEKNPDRLWDLVEQLNQTLDDREKALRGGKTRKEASRIAGGQAPEDST